MESQALTLLVAVSGAAAGSIGTWVVGRYRDRERDATRADQALRDKVHQLEIRIVRMETDLGFYAGMGYKRTQEDLDAQQD